MRSIVALLAAVSMLAPGHCARTYTRTEFHNVAGRIFDSPSRATTKQRDQLRRVVRCQLPKSRRLVRFHLQRYRDHHELLLRLGEWGRAFHALSPADQAWAYSTGACESGNDPTTNTGNGFLGAFQWVLSTWHKAGGSGSPVGASWYEQAVRAVRWRNAAGATQWPVCGA